MTKRDYYEILDIPPDADLQKIKKAYRKLARELHPDVNRHDPAAEDKFKEATEAYEVLCDPEKRQMYDTYGHAEMRNGARGAGGGFGGGMGDLGDLFETFFGGGMFGGGMGAEPPGPARGQDLAVGVEIDLHEAAFGITKDVSIELLDTCQECGGAGTKNVASIHICTECGGSGRIRNVRRTALGQFVQMSPCRRCDGEGRIIDEPCSRCHGSGRSYREKLLSVEIPAGISDGQRIRLSGQGAAGGRGGRPGDLYVQVSVAPDEVFRREEDDIIYRQDLTMVQAALGVTLTVPTLDGEEEVVFPPGTQAGEDKVLRARGVPHLRGHGRGDQHILVNVMVPRNLNDHQRELLQELDECCGMEHYQDKPEGIFHRLRNLFAG